MYYKKNQRRKIPWKLGKNKEERKSKKIRQSVQEVQHLKVLEKKNSKNAWKETINRIQENFPEIKNPSFPFKKAKCPEK